MNCQVKYAFWSLEFHRLVPEQERRENVPSLVDRVMKISASWIPKCVIPSLNPLNFITFESGFQWGLLICLPFSPSWARLCAPPGCVRRASRCAPRRSPLVALGSVGSRGSPWVSGSGSEWCWLKGLRYGLDSVVLIGAGFKRTG